MPSNHIPTMNVEGGGHGLLDFHTFTKELFNLLLPRSLKVSDQLKAHEKPMLV